MRTPPAQTDKAILPGAKSGYVLALLVLLASLFVVAWYWRSARQRELAAVQADFVASTEETTSLLYQRLGYYELVTRGGVALFGTVARPTRQQWQDYVDGLNIGQRFPALVGLGFAAYLSPGQLSDMQRAMRSDGEGLFEVRPHGVREHYGAILYLEPRSQENIDAIGFDMYSEPIRHAAMEAALDSGEARLSGTVHLVQDASEGIPSMLMFLPCSARGRTRAGFRAGRAAREVLRERAEIDLHAGQLRPDRPLDGGRRRPLPRRRHHRLRHRG